MTIPFLHFSGEGPTQKEPAGEAAAQEDADEEEMQQQEDADEGGAQHLTGGKAGS